ncbi:MAG TPA: HD domain-containing protein [Solirubrobacterales bacterium]|jgi:hypothetical protein|nr:HD domain-containing protein [Solirubrobacterales bacterium]
MSQVGSWEWAQRTGGRLSRADRAELIRQGVLAQLGRFPATWRRRFLRDTSRLSFPSPPDTALAKEAEERVRELSKPALYGHCLRTWAFAALFAQCDGVDHDEELLYLACVLHDIGLTEAHDGRDPSAACFAVEGARAAHAMLCEQRAPEDRARTVAEAISLHLNIDIPERYGPVAVLLSKGVTLDVVGRRLERLPAASLLEVAAKWPREGSGDLLLADTRRQAELRPQSRAALLHRLGFGGLISANPLDRAQ